MERPRTLVAGAIDEALNVYVLTLDGDEVVETPDEAIATAAAKAKRAGQAFTIQVEPNPKGGRPIVTELVLVVQAKAEPEPAKSSPPAPRPATQALAPRPDLPTHMIQKPQELADQLKALEQHYNVISPAIAVSQMAPGFGANLAIVKIGSTVDGMGRGSDVYRSKSIHKDNERALNKIGLQRIGQAAGVQWVPQGCGRTDDGRQPLLWRHKHYGLVRMHDGTWHPLMGSKEVDLRDGSALARTMTSDQLKQARPFGNEICETKSMERALREGLNLKHTYTTDELEKPFLIVRFSFTPDMSDPEIKKLVTQEALKGISTLYPEGASMMALPPPTEEIAGDAPATEAAAPPKKTNPFAETAAAAEPAHLTVAKVEVAKAKPPKTWIRYDVTFSNGEIASTFSETLHQVIDEAVKLKATVKYTTIANDGYNDKLDTFVIVDAEKL